MTHMTLLSESLNEKRDDVLSVYTFAYEFRIALEELWPTPETIVFYQGPPPDDADLPRFSRKPPSPTPWAIAFTPSFKKSIAGIDKKLQGRVLTAITDLSEHPLLLHGDTKKPLNAELKGLWRYRVGDFRLIYEPDEEKRLVVLLDFAARGSAYEA